MYCDAIRIVLLHSAEFKCTGQITKHCSPVEQGPGKTPWPAQSGIVKWGVCKLCMARLDNILAKVQTCSPKLQRHIMCSSRCIKPKELDNDQYLSDCRRCCIRIGTLSHRLGDCFCSIGACLATLPPQRICI